VGATGLRVKERESLDTPRGLILDPRDQPRQCPPVTLENAVNNV
jgi:hypothetical protein